MTLPIRKIDIDDLHARYKMPKPETNLKNIDDIAKALHVSSDPITTFFKKSLGTNKINGQFSYNQILSTLYKFIDSFILCQNCTYPELKYCAKNTTLRCKCLACGHNVVVSLKDPIWKRIHATTPVSRIKEPQFDFPDVQDDGIWSDTSLEAINNRRTEIQHADSYFDKS